MSDRIDGFADPKPYLMDEGALYIGSHFVAPDHWAIGINSERHAITIAGAGSGKGASVIIPNLKFWPHNVLTIDPKGEALEATYADREGRGQQVWALDPFGSANVPDRLRASYNPLDALDPDALTIREDILTIADGIVLRPDPSASHWDDGAQTIISGLIAFVLVSANKAERNLLTVRKILREDDLFAEVTSQMKTMNDCAGLCQAAYASIMAKEGGYFVSNAQKNTTWLDSRGMETCLASSSFAMSDLKRGALSVFLVLPANYLGQHGRFLRLMVRCGLEAMAQKTPSGALRDKQCLFLLDEFFSLGYIDEIAKAAGLMRGYGLQMWVILQDIGQLVKLYDREGAETFFGNADIHQFFGNTDVMTLDWISKNVGNFTIEDLPAEPVLDLNPVNQILTEIDRVKNHWLGDRPARRVGLANQGKLELKEIAENHRERLSKHQETASRMLGKPRLTPNQVSTLVRKESGVLADHAIVFIFGQKPLLLNPCPYWEQHRLLVSAEMAQALAAVQAPVEIEPEHTVLTSPETQAMFDEFWNKGVLPAPVAEAPRRKWWQWPR
jgi:hypothetical protein